MNTGLSVGVMPPWMPVASGQTAPNPRLTVIADMAAITVRYGGYRNGAGGIEISVRPSEKPTDSVIQNFG